MRNRIKATLLLLLAMILLSACSASIKEEQTAAAKSVSEALKHEPKKPNKENEDIRYHLPFGFEIKEESPNNIILKNGAKTYILFYNEHEGTESKIVYEAALNQKEFDYEKTFEEDGSFSYLLIKNTDKNINEMTVGTGGVKITTNAKTKSLASEAAAMTDILISVQKK